jgi:hypothetical protein
MNISKSFVTFVRVNLGMFAARANFPACRGDDADSIGEFDLTAKHAKFRSENCSDLRVLRTTIVRNLGGSRKSSDDRDHRKKGNSRAKYAKGAKAAQPRAEKLLSLNLAFFASFARDLPTFGCGFAALGPRGESCFSVAALSPWVLRGEAIRAARPDCSYGRLKDHSNGGEEH